MMLAQCLPRLRLCARAALRLPLWTLFAVSVQFAVVPAFAAETMNAYSIWPENWARPMFEEFEKSTGIKEGVFEPYKPPSFARLPARFRHPDGQWIAIADDPLVFMSNEKFLKEHNLKAPASWNDLLAPPYKNMLQMADARTSGTAVTRIFSILEVNGRDETKAFDYMKKLRPNVQLYTKSGGGGTLPVGLGQAGGGIFFIVDALDTKAKGYEVTISFPKEGIGTAAEGIALIKGAKNPALGKKLIDWASSPAMQGQFAKYKINFVPAHPDVALEPGLAAVLKDAKLFPIDADYAGANRKRIVDRWVAEVLNP